MGPNVTLELDLFEFENVSSKQGEMCLVTAWRGVVVEWRQWQGGGVFISTRPEAGTGCSAGEE